MICDLCRADSWETVYADVLGQGADLRRCTACGFKTYDRVLVPPAEVYDKRDYADRSFRYKTTSLARQTDRFIAASERAARTTYASLLRRVEDAVDRRPLRVYEVGCGWGRFLDVARERGAEVTGCDLNPHEAANAQTLGLDVVAGDFLDLPAPSAVDAVVLLDVLEHVWQPRALLERAVGILARGGVVLIKTFFDEWHDTINVDLTRGPLPLGQDPRTNGYYEPFVHPSHFDLPVLRWLFAECGLVIEWESIAQKWGQVTLLGRKS